MSDTTLKKLFRFVTLPGSKVCEYDKDNNLVLIDRAKFDCLAHYQKEMVYNTTSDIELMEPDYSEAAQ